MTRRIRTPYLTLVSLLLLVTWLAARGAHSDVLWYDEWWTSFYAGSAPRIDDPDFGPFTPAETWDRVAHVYPDTNPSGYYVAINLWSDVTGGSAFAMRSWSLLMAALALAFIYRAGCEIGGRRAGLYGALLLGTSAFFISYAHEARTYMQLMMATSAVLFAYARLTHPRRRWSWPLGLLLALGVAVMLYSHYLSTPVLGTLALYHALLVRRNNDVRWWRVSGLIALGALAFVPWISVAGSALGQVNADPSRDYYARDALNLLARLINRFSNQSLALAAVIGWFALRRARLAWFAFVVGFALAIVVNELFGFISDVHYLLALFPALALIGGAGLAHLPAGRTVVASVWVLAGIWLTLFPTINNDPEAIHPYLPWDGVRADLRAQAQPGDDFVFLLPEPDPNWIHLPVADHYLHDLGLQLHVLESLPETTPDVTAAQFEGFAGDAARLWIAWDRTQRPARQTLWAVDTILNDGYLACAASPQEQAWALALYIPRAGHETTRWRFGDGITLDWIGPLPGEVSNRLAVTVRTSLSLDVPRGTYSIGLHVDGPDGTLVAQTDAGLADADSACQTLRLPLDLPPGTYTLHLLVYDWATGARLAAFDDHDQPLGDRPMVSTFNVVGQTPP
ncbi:MAG: glycosyltransferase family 39 protein [Anaerolineae bacterium]|nr:glycosyltransferase family 39 protein [Anaerolineae bacterium]